MLGRTGFRWVKRAITLAAAGLAIVVVSGAANAAPEYQYIKGKLTLAPFAAPACTSA